MGLTPKFILLSLTIADKIVGKDLRLTVSYIIWTIALGGKRKNKSNHNLHFLSSKLTSVYLRGKFSVFRVALCSCLS